MRLLPPQEVVRGGVVEVCGRLAAVRRVAFDIGSANARYLSVGQRITIRTRVSVSDTAAQYAGSTSEAKPMLKWSSSMRLTVMAR